MEVRELRIGNRALRCGYLHEERNKFTEVTVDQNDIVACVVSPESFRPIPLTEEWLVKLGFEDGYLILDEQQIHILQNRVYLFGSDSCTSGHCFTTEIKFVHQLQNLYFALTGTELEIK